IMERVPKSEKKLLPDVIVTVDGLLKRAEDLARTAHAMSGDVDRAALSRLEDKIEVTKREPDSPERERQLNLLQRQRQTLTDLLTRRQLVEDQIESCVLAMQNVRFDLLRLRSAGVAAVLDDLTHATQQARALSRDVDHAIPGDRGAATCRAQRPTPPARRPRRGPSPWLVPPPPRGRRALPRCPHPLRALQSTGRQPGRSVRAASRRARRAATRRGRAPSSRVGPVPCRRASSRRAPARSRRR